MRKEKSRFFVDVFPLLVVGKTVRNEVITVYNLVRFMINFRRFYTKQKQLGCCHAIVVSVVWNRQSG